jgi:MscS family membrane protein
MEFDWQNWLQQDWLSNWVVQVFCIVLLVALVDLISRRLLRRLQTRAEATANPWDDALVAAIRAPVILMLWGLGISLAVDRLPTALAGFDLPAGLLTSAREVTVILAIFWFLLRLVAGVENNVLARAKAGQSKVDEITVMGLGRLARITVLVTGVLVLLESIGVSVSGLLAAGGIGGIAIGLAARDMLANFFGGLTIFLDRPFKVGDWIASPDREIEGDVEAIGWRQTVIRRFDKRPIYVPNAIFTNIVVINPQRMTNRRIYETIGIRYDDFDCIEGILQDVRDMLKAHEDIADHMRQMVYFTRYGASSLDIMLYCFCNTREWAEYLQVQEDVLLKVGHIIAQHGAEIAYPTRTLKMDNPEPRLLGMETTADASKSANQRTAD